MNIPFADLLTKAKTLFVRPPKNSGPLPSPLCPPKCEGDKLAKTVTPNAVMTLAPEQSAIASAPAPRIISVGRTASSAVRDLPPAVALALEPRVERVLSVALSDVAEQVPEGYLKPRASFDGTRRVLLKAAEVEKGMAAGRPVIGISAIYQQMPEIFMHAVPPGDGILVALPFDKVLEELSQLSTRDDQTSEQFSQQFETPFLQVTMEDTEKFGTKMTPVTIAEMPELSPNRMKVATAENLAAAHPEVGHFSPSSPAPSSIPPLSPPVPSEARSPLSPKPISLSPGPALMPEKSSPPPAPVAPSTPPTRPASISLVPLGAPPPPASVPKKPDFGTGEPAFPRVPASSGPPVPQVSPIRISLDPPVLAPEDPIAPPPLEPPAAPEALGSLSLRGTPASGEPQLVLPLRAILETVPPLQLNGDPGSVPVSAKISFPVSRIAPQLATGKVAIPPKDFHAAMPAEYRSLFLPDAVEVPIPLSLPDVLANLPGSALSMRPDQEEHTQDEVFETPFSQKADEDAKRFVASAPPVSPAPPSPAEAIVPPKEVAATVVPEGKTSVTVEPKPAFDAKAALAKAAALPGVKSCAVSFADGLSIAGNIPAELGLEGLSAVAPTLLQKVERHMLETKLGTLNGLTVHGENSPATFFTAGNICLTAVHEPEGLNAQTRRELAGMTKELSRTYAQPETEHVDY